MHNVVSSTSHLSGIRTDKINGDWHRLHRYNVVVNPKTIWSRPSLDCLYS